MKQVDFLITTDTGQDVAATVAVEDGKLRVLSGDRVLVTRLRIRSGVYMGGDKTIMPKDPGFLDALHVAFSGSRLRATEPYEP